MPITVQRGARRHRRSLSQRDVEALQDDRGTRLALAYEPGTTGLPRPCEAFGEYPIELANVSERKRPRRRPRLL